MRWQMCSLIFPICVYKYKYIMTRCQVEISDSGPHNQLLALFYRTSALVTVVPSVALRI